MEFLQKYGLTFEEIKEIKDNNYDNILKNVIENQDNVEKIIDYLLEIGTNKTTIKEIFIYQIGLFYKTLDEIKTSFDEYEIDSVVKSLNYDADNVELIDFI